MNGMGNEPSYKGTGGIGISVKIRNRISTLLLILLCLCLGIQASTEIREDSQWTDRLNKALSWKCMDLWCPSFNYADYGWYQDNLAEQIRGAIWRGIPLYIFLKEQETCMAYTQSEPVYDASIILQQTRDEEDALQRSVQAENEEALRDQQNPEVEQPLQEQEQDQKPDQYSAQTTGASWTEFVPVKEKVEQGIVRKRLYKTKNKKVFLGLCAGFAEYSNMPLWLVRLLTIVLIFPMALYFIIAAIVPTEEDENA